MKKRKLSILCCTVLLLIASCSTDPEPINYGKDQCENCRMTIMDNKFGCEILTTKGKIYKFDAIECMVNFLNQRKLKIEEVDKFLVTDASKPAGFIDGRHATYLFSDKFPSPMGANLSAFETMDEAQAFKESHFGLITNWEGILAELSKSK